MVRGFFGRKSSGSGSVDGDSNAKKSAKAGAKAGGRNGGTKSADGKNMIFRVTVPAGTKPGDEFQVYAGNRIVKVKCPDNCKPGQFLQITVPVEQAQQDSPAGPPDSPNVQKQSDGAYMVTVPEGVRGGQQFPVTLAGQTLMVTSPPNAKPGTQVRVVPPPPPDDPLPDREQDPRKKVEEETEPTQLFEVQVPPGVQPGRPFALLAGGVRVLVTCPPNAGPGQRIRFKLPLALTQKPTATSEAAKIKLSYDKDGWTRTIRVSDMTFQWVRMDDKGDVDESTGFNAEKSAYVRRLEFRPGPDDRVRDGVLKLVPATEAFVDSRVRGNNGDILVTYAEIADAQVMSFEDKAMWFQEKCLGLCIDWNDGHMRMNVRREFLLEDSVDAVMSLSRRDLRKAWRFEFIGEAGIDAGGLAREWFQLVTAEIFDPDMGLWQSSEANQMMMTINPASSKLMLAYLERND